MSLLNFSILEPLLNKHCLSDMCTHGRLLTNRYTLQRFYANCGKCAACQQEKANARSNRIRNEYSQDWLMAFVTLTYDPMSVPYILHDDVKKCLPDLPIYRNHSSRWIPGIQKYRKHYGRVRIDTKHIFDGNENESNSNVYGNINFMPYLKHHYGAIGVVYYPDIQKFFKRLRINLNRYYGKKIPLRMFTVFEYGGKTIRPHAHSIVFFQTCSFDVLRDTIIKSWPYGREIRRDKSVQLVQYDAASYVSSYVNCSDKLPSFIKANFNTKHSCSKLFGHHRNAFTLTSILDKIGKGDLSYDTQTNRNGIRDVINIQIPKYVINRYFPQFKGYSRLAPAEVRNLLRCVGSITNFGDELRRITTNFDNGHEMINYHRRINYNSLDSYATAVRLNNAYNYYHRVTGRNAQDYAQDYYKAWVVFASNKEKRLHAEPTQPLRFRYYNLQDIFLNSQNTEQIKEFLGVNKDALINVDPNTYPDVVSHSAQLEQYYSFYCKMKDVNAITLSDKIYV